VSNYLLRGGVGWQKQGHFVPKFPGFARPSFCKAYCETEKKSEWKEAVTIHKGKYNCDFSKSWILFKRYSLL